MNWQTILAAIRSRPMTFEEIRSQCGFASRSHVFNLATGKQKTVEWSIGDKLLKLHKKVLRSARK
jgi:hypothetical protein